MFHPARDERHGRDFRAEVLAAVRTYQRDENRRNTVFTGGNDAGVTERQGGNTFLAVNTFDGHNLFLNAVSGVQKPTALTPK